MQEKNFSGVMPAIFSVYDKQRNVIKETVDKMVDYHIENGMNGFYVGGNTGECTILPNKTRMQMVEAVKQSNKGRVPIIAHVGSSHIDDVYELIDHANEVGVDAVASLPPSLTSYYEMDEIIEYYKIIAKRSKVPIFAYVTGVLQGDLVEFSKTISSIENVAGVKMSVPDYFAFGKIKSACREDFTIISGADETMICGLIEGADGAIGTTYNMLPKLASTIYKDFKEGRNQSALENQRKMNGIIDLLISSNIAEWKAVMSFLGFDMGYTVEPQRIPDKKQLEELRNKVEKVGFFDFI